MSNAESYVQAATHCIRSEDFKKAYTLLTKAISIEEKKTQLYDLRAAVLCKLNRHDEALKDAQAMYKLDPKSSLV
jgi:Tfp pilus assembly protein PilF